MTGGVSEAVLRAAHYLLLGKELEQVNFTAVRGMEGLREAEVDLDGMTIKLAIVHGLQQAKQLLEDIKAGRVEYQLGGSDGLSRGCVGGAGQPVGTT